jgi:hypothetical protein
VLGSQKSLRLSTEVGGRRLYEPLFERAEAPVRAGTTSAFIRETIARYLVPMSEPSASLPVSRPSPLPPLDAKTSSIAPIACGVAGTRGQQ